MKIPPVKVELGINSYDIIYNQRWEVPLGQLADKRKVIISEDNVARFHLDHWRNLLPEAETIIVPEGELSKAAKYLDYIYTELIEKSFSRDSVILALGGGMIGDLAGFAAATFMRGVELVHIPTSLLAMVDSSIGGKVGINHPLGKNLIGAFYQPKAVFIDTRHLKTLPRREWLCGLGEMLKYGIIKDSELYELLARRIRVGEPPEKWAAPKEIRRCAELKAEIVSLDERESNLRAILNFGHTIGHALESVTGYDFFRRGEAVIAGMAGAAFISHRRGMLPVEDYNELTDLFARIPLPSAVGELSLQNLLDSISHDKKVRGGKVRFVLVKSIGEVCLVDDIDETEICSALKFTIDFVRGKTL